jgi:general secretion pathway protein G
MFKIKSHLKTLDRRGFTLTEMLIVIAIIALLGTFVTQNLIGKLSRAKADTTKTQIRQVGVILDDFRRECGFYPTTPDQGLEALISKPTAGRECKNYDPEGYIKGKKLPRDGWDNDFIYESDGNKYLLKSLGNDGKEGGEGFDKDITSDDL